MKVLNDYYTDFQRIDLDMPGGYGYVAKVKCNQESALPYRAFKLLRHEIDYDKGLIRFIEEHRLLTSISNDELAPYPVTRIYDSGFVSSELSSELQLSDNTTPSLNILSIESGRTDDFISTEAELKQKEPGKWLPYLVVDLAPYKDCLLRQIHFMPNEKDKGFRSDSYRLPIGEVIIMAYQLLTVMEYLQEKHNRAYMDWKPEHVFWNGFNKHVKLVDWNVTVPLDNSFGVVQNIRDDIRVFCGAVLYIGLTFSDPENPENTKKPIGPRPTDDFQNPISEIRNRYWTSNPNFYQHDNTLDDKIKDIVRKGLNPKQGYDSPKELKIALLDYAKNEWGISEKELLPDSEPESEYFYALSDIRKAQNKFLQVQQRLINLTAAKGDNPELMWLFEAIKDTLLNLPGS